MLSSGHNRDREIEEVYKPMNTNRLNAAENQTVNPQLLALALQKNQQLVGVNRESASDEPKEDNLLSILLDQASISDAAKAKLASEKELLKFSRLANRVDAPFDPQKVSDLKDQLSTPEGLAAYLQKLDSEGLANNMLKGFWQ